jgi:hypothetical protein
MTAPTTSESDLLALAGTWTDSAEDRAAKAIYDAVEPLSGDHIATVIHMSDHLFWHELPGETDIESQLAAVRLICRVAARAARLNAGEGA